MRLQIEYDSEEFEERKTEIEKVLQSLEKYLGNFNEDMKTAKVRILEGARWGYRIKFELILPGKTIFAQAKGENFSKTLREVRSDAARQLKKHTEKLRRY